MVEAVTGASASEPVDLGRYLRKEVPRSSHGDWFPSGDRPDPVDLIEAQNEGRLAFLVPLRRSRMSDSPFTFYRGSAAIMAADLATTPTSGLTVQLCGDAHLSNFGVYGSPERNLMFDINDFDETLPGPFEWDVKRLAASFTIAAQHRGFHPGIQRSLAESVSRAYRVSMSRFADKGWLETWYDHVTEQRLTEWLRQRSGSKARIDRVRKFSARARSRDALSAAVKLVDEGKDGYRFKSSPPVLVPIRDLPEASRLDDVEVAVRDAFDSYKASLTEDTRHLVGRYRMVDVALKVVGVGSVGTRCWIALLLGRHASDVLLLQVKEAVPSVLETHLPDSRFRLHGRRVVEGQRLMQASSDVFLGWSRGLDRHYYWRQLRDWKGSVDLNSAKPDGFENYARLCGYTLARAHAVSGDPAAIAGYLGSGAIFDTAVGEFSTRYAGQNLADYQAFTAAIDDGLEIATD